MPPQKRAAAKPDVQVSVDPPSAAHPRVARSSGAPTKKAVAAAVQQSAERLAAQAEPPTDVHPKPTTPSTSEVDAAVEQSAEFLQTQAEPPTDVHPAPTTPSKAEVEAAVAQSAENLEDQGIPVDTDSAPLPASPSPAPTAPTTALSAAPVSAAGASAALAAAPVGAGRDKTQDATPSFSAPVLDSPRTDND